MTISENSSEPAALPVILIVDDQPLNIHLLNQILQADYDVYSATSGEEALAFCQSQQPDLILLDVMMPEMDGYEVCRRLKRESLTSDIPVIFITVHNNTMEEESGLAAGAVDFIARSASPGVMRARVKTHLKLKQQADLLRSYAMIDGLTGIANRRHFDQALSAEWRRCARLGKPLALILIDIDFFKQFNDYYGHQAGDACLIKVAACLKAELNRSYDLVARYGGEEFVCLLPETTLSGAETKAQAMLQSISDLGIPHVRSELGGKVSISLGVAVTMPANGEAAVDLIQSADRLLYEAKHAGRNQVKSMQLTSSLS